MPTTFKRKAPGKNWNEWKNWDGTEENKPASVRPWGDGEKGIPHRTKGHWTNPAEHENGNKGDWLKWDKTTGKRVCTGQRATSSGSNARKAASAMISKIPYRLAQWIARTYYPNLAARDTVEAFPVNG